MAIWKIYYMRATVSGIHRVAREGKWVFGEGIEISCIYNIYEPIRLSNSYGPWAYLREGQGLICGTLFALVETWAYPLGATVHTR